MKCLHSSVCKTEHASRFGSRTEKKLLVWLVIVSVLLLSAQSVSFTEYPDFVCTPGIKAAYQIQYTYSSTVLRNWSMGFWIRILSSSTYLLPIFKIGSPLYDVKFILESTGPFTVNLKRQSDSATMFTLSESSAFEDLTNSRMTANSPGNSWNYIAFVFRDDGKEYGIATINQTPTYENANAVPASSPYLIIGSDDENANCNYSFQISKWTKFDEAYDPLLDTFGINEMLQDSTGMFYALYKLNRFPLAETLVNILDTSSYQASVSSKALSRLSFNFAQISGFNRFGLDAGEVEITWPVSPKISRFFYSYALLFFMKIQGLPRLAQLKLTGGTMPTTPFHLIYYQRTSAANPANKIISTEQFLRFDSWQSELQILLNNSVATNDVDTMSSPFIQNIFDISKLKYVSISIYSDIFSDIKVSIGGYSSALTSSPLESSISSLPFADDDVHKTIVAAQTDNFLVRILCSEVLLHESSPTSLTSGTAKLASSSTPITIQSSGVQDLRRFSTTSMLSLVLTNTSEASTSNCSMANCEYCENGTCLICKIPYYLAGTCVLCASNFVFDIVTRKCIKTGITTSTSLVGLDTIINTLAQTAIVAINISFEMQYPYSSPVVTDKYAIYFNSMQSLSYDPFTSLSYSDTVIQDQLTKLGTFFADHQAFLAAFGPYANYQVRFASAGPLLFQILNPGLIFIGNSCYSPSLTYSAVTATEVLCGDGCSLGRFRNTVSGVDICDACSPFCLRCISSIECIECYTGYFLIRGYCWSTPPPGALFPVNELAGPIDTSSQISDDESLSTFVTIHDPKPMFIIFTSKRISEKQDESTSITMTSRTCKLGYLRVNSKCLKCPRMCLDCPSLYACNKCDSNFQLNNQKQCISKTANLLPEASEPGADTSGCGTCYQTYDIQSPSCFRCSRVCPCLITKTFKDNSFLLQCQNALLDSQNLMLFGSNNQYYQRESSGDFDIWIFLKLKYRAVNYTINLSLVKNTTNCVIDPGTTFALENSDSIVLPPNRMSTDSKIAVGVAVDVIVSALTLLSLPFVIYIIAYLQFNKFFLYLSTLGIMVGGVFDYVNYNLYSNVNPERPWFIDPIKHYNFAHLNWRYHANKLTSWADIITFFTFIGACLVVPVVFRFLTRNSKSNKIKEIREKIDDRARKTLFVISKKDLYRFILSMSWLSRLLFETDNIAFSGMIMLIIGSTIFFPLVKYWEILKHIRSKQYDKRSFLNVLKDPNLHVQNKMLIKSRVIEEVFLIFRCLFLYYLRSHPTLDLVLGLLLLAMQIAVTSRFVVKINLAHKVITLIELISLFLFVLLMFIKSLDFMVPVLLFDVVYLICNLSKFTNCIVEYVVVFRKNRTHQKEMELLNQVVPVPIQEEGKNKIPEIDKDQFEEKDQNQSLDLGQSQSLDSGKKRSQEKSQNLDSGKKNSQEPIQEQGDIQELHETQDLEQGHEQVPQDENSSALITIDSNDLLEDDQQSQKDPKEDITLVL